MNGLYLRVSPHEQWGNLSARILLPRGINTEDERRSTRRVLTRKITSLQMQLDDWITREGFSLASPELLAWARQHADAGKVVQNPSNLAQLRRWFDLHHEDALKFLNAYAGLSYQLAALDLWDKLGTFLKMEDRIRRHVDDFVDLPNARGRTKTFSDDAWNRMAQDLFSDAHDASANPLDQLKTMKPEDFKESIESDLTSEVDRVKKTLVLTSSYASYPDGPLELHIGYKKREDGTPPKIEAFCHVLRKFLFRRGFPVEYTAPRG